MKLMIRIFLFDRPLLVLVLLGIYMASASTSCSLSNHQNQKPILQFTIPRNFARVRIQLNTSRQLLIKPRPKSDRDSIITPNPHLSIRSSKHIPTPLPLFLLSIKIKRIPSTRIPLREIHPQDTIVGPSASTTRTH